MEIKYCPNPKCDWIKSAERVKRLTECPKCGRTLLVTKVLAAPPLEVPVPPIPEQPERNNLSVLLADALATPQGQRLVRKVLEKIDEKFFK